MPLRKGVEMPIITLTHIKPYSKDQILLTFSNQETYLMSYSDLRLSCVCAGCVDERTGKRLVFSENVTPTIRVTDVRVIGRYAINIHFSDGHTTGIFEFKRLYETCQVLGHNQKVRSENASI
jgi:DUF971 family protein